MAHRIHTSVAMLKRHLAFERLMRAVTAGMVLVTMSTMVFAQRSLPIERIKLPPGFSIQLIARVPSAREMTWGAEGTLFVGSREGRVYGVRLSSDDDPQKAQVHTLANGLRSPV